MDNNTLKWLGAGVVIYLLFIRKKDEPTADIVDAVIDDIEQTPQELLGCTDEMASNYNNLANTDDSSCIYPPTEVLGCMDSNATNFNNLANVDDSSCTYITVPTPDVPGCMNPIATNYDPLATMDNASCVLPVTPILGCSDVLANNYDSFATSDDGSCAYTEVDCYSGCPNPSVTSSVQTICPTSNPNLTMPSCSVPVSGCQNPQAFNYNPNATMGCS